MRICRFDRGSQKDRLGVVEGDKVYDVSAVIDLIEPVRWPVPMGDRMIANLPTLRPKMEELIKNGAKSYALSDVRLNAPVANPSKFFCGAGNWPEHKEQMGGKNMRNLGWLHKTTNALAGPADDVVLTRPGRVTFYEAVATIIGKEAKNVAAKDALDYVAGYAACLDMSMQGEENFSHNKCYDTFGVIGPWMVTTDEIPDPRPLTFRFYVNDVQKQGDKIERLVLSVEEMIEFASGVATLYPGDVIMSGTPIGISQVFPGDVMRLEFDVIGTMVNKVAGVV